MANTESEPGLRRRPTELPVVTEIKPQAALANPFRPVKTPESGLLAAIPVRRVAEIEVHGGAKPVAGTSLSGEMGLRGVLAAVDLFKNADIKDRDKFLLLNDRSLVG